MFASLAVWTTLACCLLPKIVLDIESEATTTADPLISKLGAPRFVDREHAATALEKLGVEAIPNLRAAKDSRDPEIRLRAASVIAKIERRRLSSPTLVRLDFRDRPLVEIVEKISERSRHLVKLAEDLDEDERRRRLNLVDESPVPFWEAIDRLCSQSNLRMSLSPSFDSREPASVTLDMPWGANSRPAVAIDGPFRGQLPRGFPSREIQRFNAPRSPNSVVFNLTVQPEPGLLIRRIDPPRVIEAVDDRGQSLEAVEVEDPMMIQGRRADPANQGSSATAPLKLGLPKNSGRILKRLKIAVPILIASRRPDPTEIPLTDAAGKTFPIDDGLIRFVRVATEPGGVIEVVVTRFEPLEERAQFVRQRGFGRLDPPDGSVQDPRTRLTLVDRDGKPCRWDFEQPEIPQFRGRFRRGLAQAAGERRLFLRLADDSPPADRILYRGVIEAEAEAVFEFDDVPLP